MVRDGTEYTYNFCNTSQLGTYIVSGYGDVDGEKTVFVYDFEITQTGERNEQGLYLVFITISAILGILLFIFSFVYDDKLFIFSAIGFFGAGVMTLYFPFGNEQQFITNGISILLNGIGMVILGVYVIKDWFNA